MNVLRRRGPNFSNQIPPDESTKIDVLQGDSTPVDNSPSPEIDIEPSVDAPSQDVTSKLAIKVYPKRNRRTVDWYEPKWLQLIRKI